jgi:hypothetical protein
MTHPLVTLENEPRTKGMAFLETLRWQHVPLKKQWSYVVIDVTINMRETRSPRQKRRHRQPYILAANVTNKTKHYHASHAVATGM